MISRWKIIDVNPEPWAIGPVGVSRRGGKFVPYVGRNQQLDAYKNAVREALTDDNGGAQFAPLPPGPVELVFYFWRRRSEYSTPRARQHRKHQADVTNMQKATEDALQGVLFENDKDTVSVTSYIVEQGPEVEPRILIGWGSGGDAVAAGLGSLPRVVRDALERKPDPYTQPTLDEGPDVEDIF